MADEDEEFMAPAAPGQYSADLEGCEKYLTRMAWPNGLKKSVIKSLDREMLRYFIIDNSGSMASDDGSRLDGEENDKRMIRCTRWAELKDTVKFHANFAECAACPTQFRLLNGCEPLMIGSRDDDGENLKKLMSKVSEAPFGATPICTHVKEIVKEVELINGSLPPAEQKKVILIVCTDGEPSDGLLSEALAPLLNYPVWMVVRLCTDQPAVTQYWDDLDKEMEIELDIIDDFLNEARSVGALNRWLTYGEPLHRIREWGFRLKELDSLDERMLTSQQMHVVVNLILLGEDPDDLPSPDSKWLEFYQAVEHAKHLEPKTWDIMRRRKAGWINMNVLKSTYGAGNKCSIM